MTKRMWHSNGSRVPQLQPPSLVSRYTWQHTSGGGGGGQGWNTGAGMGTPSGGSVPAAGGLDQGCLLPVRHSFFFESFFKLHPDLG